MKRNWIDGWAIRHDAQGKETLVFHRADDTMRRYYLTRASRERFHKYIRAKILAELNRS
jgi:hypothetical protein